MNQFIIRRFVLLFLGSFAIYLFGNNFLHLTDPDEVFYSLSAKEMIAQNEWLTPSIFNQPQFEKPILTYWLIQIAFMMFGENAFAARFFPAFFGACGVVGVYALGLLGFMNERKAFLSAFILATSAFYMSMAKTVFTDMIFTVFILYAILSFFMAYVNSHAKRFGILFFYFFTALATLTKGPLGLAIPLAIVFVFLLYQRQTGFLKSLWFVWGALLYVVVAVPWYGYEISRYGQEFIQEFFYNDHWRRLVEAEHRANDTWYFYPGSILAGMFPWTFFVVFSLVDIYKRLKFSLKPFEYLLLSWVLVVFLVFQVAHSKLTSYVLPLFPALGFLCANFIDERIEAFRHSTVKNLGYVTLGFLFVFAVVALAAYPMYKEYVPSLLPGYFLSAAVVALAGINLVLFFKDKVRQGIAMLGFSLAPVFVTAFMIVGDLEPYVSMHEACSYLPVKMARSTILVSKLYARGVAYHSGHDVAVMNVNGENYFSPHPIPILNTQESLAEFLRNHPQVFAILKKSHYEHLVGSYQHQYNIQVLKVSAKNYVLKIEPKKTS